MDELRCFVKESKWTFAKSMPQTPHEYTLRCDARDEALFERVVIYVRQVGYHQKWARPPTPTSTLTVGNTGLWGHR